MSQLKALKKYKINSILNIEKLRVVGALMLERVRQKLSNFKSKISSLVEKHQLFSVSKNNIKRYLVAILILSVAIIAINSSLAATVPVKSIEIKSENLDYDKSEQGAWKVTKSAVWTDRNKARITFDVDTIEKIPDKNRRIILILDCSESMNNVDFQRLKNNINSVLSNVSNDKKHNTKFAYVEFNDTAETKTTDFQSEYTVEKYVEAAAATGGSNYYAALQQVDNILKNYTKVDTENVTAIFITSGSPTVNTPNEVSQYAYLKEQYPYLEIKAIQYSIGDEVLESVKNISDKQYVVSTELFKRTFNSIVFGVMEYDNFSITDKINANYFNIDSVLTTDGEALINGESINWNITNSHFTTGTKKQLNIDISVKDDATINATDLCETNSEEAIISKLDDISENITSTLTPILSAGHTVTYDINSPSTCTPTFTPTSENHFVFEQVSFSKEVPTCLGYQFKGWQVINKNVTVTNSEGFIMPDEDVIVKALWTNLSLNKSNAGKVTEQATLYNVIKYEANSGGLAKEYTGSHQDSLTGTGNKKIYYYHADTDEEGTMITYYKNNVIFAGMCWHMVRTTDTGGIKMIYNGIPGADNACYYDNETTGYLFTTLITLDDDEYYYSTGYEYDSETKLFSLSGTILRETLTNDNAENLINKYTCVGTRKEDTCGSLMYITDVITSISIPIPIVMVLGPINTYDIGTSNYNIIYSDILNTDDLQASVGYMYNTTYSKKKNIIKVSEEILKGMGRNNGIYYSSSYSTSNNHYRLRLPTKSDASDDLSTYKGKYTLGLSLMLGTSSQMTYVADTDSSTLYTIKLTYPNDLNYYNYTYSYGDSYIENEDGTYTINNATTFKRTEWLSNYTKVKNKYICKLNDNNKCNFIHYVTKTSATKYDGLAVDGVLKHASSFTYENGVYKLSDDATTKWDIIENETTNIDNSHYICTDEINENNECKELAYVYYFNGTDIYGVNLKNGKNVETALQEMLYADDVNMKNSTAKAAIDAWYEKNLNQYTSYLEDTVFCNNRTITNIAGWNSKGGKIKDILTFKGKNLSGDLSCQNITDKFSVSNDKAKLKYPVGLLTGEEISLINNGYIIPTNKPYYLLSPTNVSDQAYISVIDKKYNYTEIQTSFSTDLSEEIALKPVISLKPNTKYSKGDGSMENPYIVDMSE